MALKPLNSVGGFSVGEIPANVILANADITANKGTFVGNVAISNSNPAYGILTDNLYYSNGVPWDLQQAAGSNTQIQFNNNNDFGASANFTFDTATNLLTVTGNVQFNNANLGNLTTSNFVNVASNTVTSNLTVNLELAGNTANFSGNIKTLNANLGNLVVANYANFTNDIVVQGNIANANNISVTNNLNAVVGNFSGNINSLNANLGNLAQANFVNVASNVITSNLTVNLELQANTANFDGNVIMDNWLTVANTANVGNLRTNNLLYANGVPWDLQEAAGSNTEIQYNLNNNFAASANFTFDPSTNQFTVLGNGQFNNANLGNLAIANFVNVASNIVSSNLNVNLELAGNTANFSGNVVVPNLTVNSVITGNTANFSGNVVVPNLTVNLTLSGNTANFSGNVVAPNVTANATVFATNANISGTTITNALTVNNAITGNTANFSGNVVVPNLTVNLQLDGNTANFSGNVVAPNFVGTLANGNSNVRIFGNANLEVSINGSANVATFTDTALLVVGNIQSTAGNVLANGNVSANGFVNAANANVTGEANLGSVLTSNITANGNLTITASGTDKNINLVPGGPNGVIDVSLTRVTQVADPTQPRDAATKEYVDNTSKGLTIHNAVRVTSVTNLNATYANGGSVLTTIAITGGKTIQFSAAHGLTAGDELAWDNSFNGIVGDDPYFVFSTPAADTITVKAGYFGAEVTTLTNGTGLSQTARANTGVGATLTNAGANAALSIDSVALASTNRVLVQGQTNQFENGIYTVTTVGDGSTAWVLTRATDEDTYSPTSTTALGYGDYFFVQQGTSYAGSSYTLTSPVGEILFGYTNIAFSQFSAAGAYTAGNGINITGTIISANVDNDTTAISAGNIVVKTSANLVTPNLGDATFSSLSWNNLSNGNVTANNISIGNLANITLDLTVGGNIQANGTISANANVSGLNITTAGNVHATGVVIAANVTANSTVFAANANVSGTTITNVLTVNTAFNGNTANFSGNIVANNVTVNLELAGNTANFTGNVVANNFSTSGSGGNITGANVVIANTFQGNLVATYANVTGNVTAGNVVANNQANVGNLYVGANVLTNLLPNANLTLNVGSSTQRWANVYAGNIDASGNLIISGNLSSNNYTANIITANVKVNVGNTSIYWGEVTTTSITANQTISSVSVTGITGVQWLVKGLDSGGKHSVATVQAVTDGTFVDWATFGGVQLGGTTGTLAVNISGGNILLQVTPASSNSTVWVTQYRTI